MTAVTTEPAEAFAAPLDLLLTQGALRVGPRALPLKSTFSLGRALASRPRRVLSRAGSLTAELSRIAVGTSTVEPSRRDKRFADPAWTHNPMLRRIVQSYLATSQAVEAITQDVPMDWRDAERIRFAMSNIIEAAAPSNNPLISPVAWKAAIDTGGLSAVRGVRNLINDLSSSPRIPSMVDRSGFKVGGNLGASKGSVVFRTPVFELVQYAPTTETVRAEPVLIVPPTINKFYVLDLSPGRSFIEHLVGSGQQVFIVSWRNPDARHSKWGIDVYAQAILEAAAAVREICKVEQTHLLAACSGGILTSMTASHLADRGHLDQIATLGLLVTVLDQAKAGTTTAFVDESVASAAMAASRRKGYLDGRRLAEVFAWLRPGDLIWSYWVNNYLAGNQPPAFDILAWNADTTRMPARLHADFMRLAMSNGLTRPGGATVLNTETDLRRVTVDSYVVAGIADHLCPWQSCYRSTQLLGGDSRFVLSTNGHIAALVNPPGNPKSSFLTQDEPARLGIEPEEWMEGAKQQPGSWWPDYINWLSERSKEDIPAPTEMGSSSHPPLESAPGSYVLDA